MSIEAVGALTLLIGVASLLTGADVAMRAFVLLSLLGSSAAVLLGGSGTIQPAHLMLGFLAIAIFSRPEHLAPVLRSLVFPREGFWYVAFVAFAAAGAFLLPRLFAGVTGVNAIGATAFGPSLMLVPLGPTSGNITQTIYLLADLACFAAVLGYAATPRGLRALVIALLAYAAANIAFAALDIATAASDTGYLLAFIRNADYQLHVEETTGGLRRIVGSFTETSAFSAATVGSLAFTARLWLAGWWPRTTGLLSLASLALLAFSTSSTAYAATPPVLALLYAGALVRTVRGRATAQTLAFTLVAPLTVALAALAIALTPSAADAVWNFLDITLLDKSLSPSGLERQQWNQTAFRNFLDTYGWGGGLGSIRASSFPLAVLSNTGIPGAVCFCAFSAHILRSRDLLEDDSLRAAAWLAARSACIGILIAATVSGALVDLGLPFYVFAALACAARYEQAPMRSGQRDSTVSLAMPYRRGSNAGGPV